MTHSQFESGFFVLDKPEGVTSHDVVQAVRRHLKFRKIGHLGTLDPMATGVLPLALGKATRLIEFLKEGLKIYEGTLRLGFSTDTYDRDGQPTSDPTSPQVSQEQLNQLGAEVSGDQHQVPPPFSAKRVQGVRAYELARQGVPFSMAAQKVRIERLEFRLREPDEVDFLVRCSAGTYVRSIVHDLGTRLGCGAHLTRLRRLASGDFLQSQSITLSKFTQTAPTELAGRMIRIEQVLLGSPAVCVDPAAEAAIASGRDFQVAHGELPSEAGRAAFVRVLSSNGHLVALAAPQQRNNSAKEDLPPDASFHPFLVLAAKEV